MHISTMMPLQFCIPIYGLIISCCLLTGVTLLGMAMVSLYEMGCTELTATLSMIVLWGFLRLCLPPWSDTLNSLFPYSKFNDPRAPKFLALDHFIYQGVEDEEGGEKENEGATEEGDTSCKTFLSSSPVSSSLARRTTTTGTKLCPTGRSAVAGSPACAICLSSWNVGDRISMGRSCGHVFHQECLKLWLPKSTTCPYCRCDLQARCEPCDLVDKGDSTPDMYTLEWVYDAFFNG